MNTKNRLALLRHKLAEQELDAILISETDNRYYLSGFNGSAGFLLITEHAAILATDFRYIEQAKIQAPDYDIFKISGNTSEWFPRLVSGHNLKNLAFESAYLTFATHRQFTDILKKAGLNLNLVPEEGIIETLRAVKEPEEIRLISEAVALTDRALEFAQNAVRSGISEMELAWEIEKFMRESGSQSVPFELIVAGGASSALPHAKPSSQAIMNNQPVVVDIGAKIKYYTSDLTRTLYLGERDETFKKVYDTVLDAQLTALSNIKPGMSGHEADSIARKVIEKAGYAEAFGHGLGHGIGLATHEQPRLGPNSKDILTEGMVFTVEPGIYIAGWGGVRIEDDAIIENGKIRVISKANK